MDSSDVGAVERAERLVVPLLGPLYQLRHRGYELDRLSHRDAGRLQQTTVGGQGEGGHDDGMPAGGMGFESRNRPPHTGAGAFRSRKKAQKNTAAASPMSETTRQSAP